MINNRFARCCYGLLILSFGAALPGCARMEIPGLHSRYLNEVDVLHSEGVPASYLATFPTPPPSDQNADLVYLRIGDKHTFPETAAEIAADAVRKASPDSAAWKSARSFVIANKPLIAEVHKAAAIPGFGRPVPAEGADPNAIMFPEDSPMRRSARILAVESLVIAHDGKLAEAVKNAALGFRIAEHAYPCPLLMGWLNGMSIDEISLRSIEHIMLMGRNDPKIIAVADRAIADNWRIHPVIEATRNRAAFDIAELEYLRAHRLDTPDVLGQGKEGIDLLKSFAKTPATWNDFIDSNGFKLLECDDDLIQLDSQPYPPSLSKRHALETRLEHPGFDGLLAAIFCTVLGCERQAATDADVSIAHAAAAVLTWKCRHGEYPVNLQQAMARVPIDPFDLKPIRYRREGEGFVLYTVGESGTYMGDVRSSRYDYESVLRVSKDGTGSWQSRASASPK
jgi:hypothetical protein